MLGTSLGRTTSLLRTATHARALRIAVACDHAGFALKEELAGWLRGSSKHSVADLGPADGIRVDYPDYARAVCAEIERGHADLGLLVCGTGVGMSMAANKSAPCIRAAVCSDTFTARATREHNDCNVLCIGERVVGPGLARDIVGAWLDATFEGGRHQLRVDKIAGGGV